MYSLILCGGSGTRLWPLSRKNFPKQFLKLYNNKSLIQETFLRMREIVPLEKIFFITNQDNLFNVFNQIKEIEKNFDKKNILVEPDSLNTAPAIIFALKYLKEKTNIDLSEPIVITPADHYIGDKKSYLNVIKSAVNFVNNNIGTIGIAPTSPETGYGYIKKGEKQNGYYKVLEFKEKPNKLTAKAYIESKNFFWNSGIYIFNINTFIKELEKCSPDLYSYFIKNLDIFISEFKKMPSISIDCAISEKSKKMVVFKGDFIWSDIGSFDSLKKTISNNNPKHINIDSQNIFVRSENNRLIATIGVEDLTIIENSDSILIQKNGQGEKVREVVKCLKKKNFKESEHSLIVYRPWGKYEVLIDSSDHKVKKITVYPGSKLSLQSHYHRAEHWIVVKGIAKIVNGDQNILLQENESTFIPAFAKHRLENPGKINLEIIEVQTGSYLEEDDIIRYDDEYGRLEI
ncbi:mannose-1-phosphate guanylyltransferase/mannose-6-phosphate isomerase [bacterium]|nr:mannose-1-phosphate guanylyltransferase/mannose-6-phosphate isomerase [bacterium]